MSNAYPRISIVTPSFNDSSYLETTIRSILDQRYPNLEYIIIDGGSTDGSVDIIKKYESQLTYWVSERDNGMYHALEKGFAKATGEVMGWINSDDKHHHGSLFTLAQIFTDYPDIQWLQGTPNIISEDNRVVYASVREEIDKLYFYSYKHIVTGRYLQQESTFWRRSLWLKAGAHISQQYKYAGDFELWMRFFQHEKLYNVGALLGSFRLTSKEQASINNVNEYVQETLKILAAFPLNKNEQTVLRLRKFFEWLEKKLHYLRSALIARAYKAHQSAVYKRIHFDPKQQRFNMNK
jgi:glycosyltransferase involved in cell wall biosynthesis